MLVVDLHCEGGHLFEGWFASADDLSSQKERGLLTCPVCGSHDVTRRPSAARLNVSALKAAKLEGSQSAPVAQPLREVAAAPSPTHDAEAAQALQAMQKLYWQAVRHVVANTEDVGDRFVDEVRGMHHGDVPERAIRGQATAEERAELREEGIDVLSMPIPAGIKGTVQ